MALILSGDLASRDAQLADDGTIVPELVASKLKLRVHLEQSDEAVHRVAK